ncbi:MAG: glycosyltransferase [Cytophagales bacterium]|nr:MAG: glycosyltransferase [Cytophagales bacterium]
MDTVFKASSIAHSTNSQPFISIIITVLNGAKTIADSLRSIEQQIFTDYELVIVDGGSVDNTVQIIQGSSIKNKVVKVVPGLGLYAGLNTGVKSSTGQWLYFMGADDKLHAPNTLQEVIGILTTCRNTTQVLVGDVRCIKQGYTLQPLFGSPYLMRHQVHHQGMFYRREIFNDILYDENLKISSDYELNLKLALAGIPHESMSVVVCDFGGDGVSENQLKRGYSEMQRVHRRLFNGAGRNWVMSYFWLRRSIGALIRRYNVPKVRAGLRNIFG